MTSLDPDRSQTAALDAAAAWYASARQSARIDWCDQRHGEDDGGEDGQGLPHTHGAGPAPVMSIGGLAGTGKTTLIRMLARRLDATPVHATPTHQAARVLRAKLPDDARVNTHHSLTYATRMRYHCTVTGERVERIPHHCGGGDMCEHPLRFTTPCTAIAKAHRCRIHAEPLKAAVRSRLGGHADLIVLDEASMLTRQDIEDTRSLGVPVLLIGDHGQLPPVKGTLNPWMREPDVELTENYRQDEASGIIAAALTVRTTGRLPLGRYGEHTEVIRMTDRRLPPLLTGRLKAGPNQALIVPTNRLRARMNRAYHAVRYGETPLVPGDRVVCLQRCVATLAPHPRAGIGETLGRQDETWVHNGTTGTVREVRHIGSQHVMALALIDQDGTPGRRLLVTVGLNQLGQPGRLGENERPRDATLWDYAYAITAHKAQGAEYAKVLVYGEPSFDYARWMYTALTRARERLIVAVN